MPAEENVQDYPKSLWNRLNWDGLLSSTPAAINLIATLWAIPLPVSISLSLPSNGKLNYLHDNDFRTVIFQMKAQAFTAFSKSHVRADNLIGACRNLSTSIADIVRTVTRETPSGRLDINAPILKEHINGPLGMCDGITREILEHLRDLLYFCQEFHQTVTETFGDIEHHDNDYKDVVKRGVQLSSALNASLSQTVDFFEESMIKPAEVLHKTVGNLLNTILDALSSPEESVSEADRESIRKDGQLILDLGHVLQFVAQTYTRLQEKGLNRGVILLQPAGMSDETNEKRAERAQEIKSWSEDAKDRLSRVVENEKKEFLRKYPRFKA